MSLEIALERIKTVKKHKDTFLDLADLGLTEIPEEVIELKWLTHLVLDNNQIYSVEILKHFKHLKVLNLGNNRIREIADLFTEFKLPMLWQYNFLNSFTDLSKIEIIRLILEYAQDTLKTQNKVTVLIEDLNLNAIQFLDLNFLKELGFFIEHDVIQNLIIALTKFRDLTLNKPQNLTPAVARDLTQAQDRTLGLALDLAQDIAQFRNQTLDVGLNNFFRKIQIEECNEGIYVKGNPLEYPPPEIIQQGNLAIKTFIKDFAEKESLNEVKVILVGEGASGKTSLVKRLLKKDFDKQEEQTHGIKISKHNFRNGNTNFTVNFWDFGGQEIMHATHQFFLTKRCLYLLVLDSRKDEKAEYWLNYIQSFGGNAPVLVILNKTDENPSFDVNRKFLNKKYSNIKNYYKISCLSQKGIEELRKDLIKRLWDLELRNTGLPKSWFKVKKELEQMTKDYIGYKQYQAICKDKFVSDSNSQKILLELLNDLGIALNYEQLRLYDTQVLNPLWLTNAVYRIINSPILVESKGRFHINDLEAIINDPRYQKENPEHWTNIFKFWKPEQKLHRFPEEKFLFVVAMMKQFELLFQIDDYHYLIPGLLTDEENTYPFDLRDTSLEFIIEYQDFLPTSIIPRLMVKLHKYIYNDQIWKTGMVLEEKLLFNSLANIVLDKDSKKISIAIKGDRNRDFLTVIRETIKEINASYQNLEVIEWVPLPELYRKELLLVDYQELLGHEVAGQSQYFSGRLRKHFPVADLLNGIEKPENRRHSQPCHLFISYSHKDPEFKEKLSEHLIPLVRLNKASLWDDNSIDAGKEWEYKIFENLEKADIVLCLISSSFIASDFCYTKELNQALKAHQKGQKIVIPIRAKEVNWDNLDIAKIQGLPTNNWMQDINDNKSWTEISKGIEAAIDSITKKI